MDNLVFSLNATIPIFMIMVVGYVLKQIGMFNENFVSVLNKFNFKVALPVLLVMDLASADFYEVWDTTFVLYCFIVTVISICAAMLLATFVLRDIQIRGEFIQACYRGSAAVMGSALIANIYGSSVMAPLMILGSVPLYNVMAVIVLSLTAPGSSSIDKKQLVKSIKGIFTNPILIGIFVGLVISLLKIKFPTIVQSSLHNIAVLATPTALLGLGAGFEGRKALAKVKPTMIASVVKLFIQPAIFLPIAYMLGFRDDKMVAILIMLGAPTTASSYIMAKNMKHEGVLTSSCVVTTTLLCSISMTLWLFVLRSLNCI